MKRDDAVALAQQAILRSLRTLHLIGRVAVAADCTPPPAGEMLLQGARKAASCTGLGIPVVSMGHPGAGRGLHLVSTRRAQTGLLH